jgi:prepilin-type N-terminal cleavage/methylation domain-containing protein
MSAAGDRGMTLLEMLVVLAIMGFISALVVVRLDRAVALYALRESESAVAASLKFARARAIRGNEPVVFAVNGDGTAYGMSDGALAALPSGVVLHPSTGAGVMFFPDGTTNGGRFEIQNAPGRVALAVDAATGEIAAVPP